MPSKDRVKRNKMKESQRALRAQRREQKKACVEEINGLNTDGTPYDLKANLKFAQAFEKYLSENEMQECEICCRKFFDLKVDKETNICKECTNQGKKDGYHFTD